MGKSSTMNSIFKEKLAQPSMFQGDLKEPLVISRQAGGFTLTVIDTPGLLDADHINQAVCLCRVLYSVLCIYTCLHKYEYTRCGSCSPLDPWGPE